MKILKSIKWRLQIWYGLILVIVLTALGFTAYQLQRDQQFNRIDGELQRRFAAVADALRPHPPGPGHRPFDHPPPDQMPDALPPPDQPEPRDFQLPPQAVAMFGSSDPHKFYYAIFGRDGNRLASSTNAPDFLSAPKQLSGHPLPRNFHGLYGPQGGRQFAVHSLPSGEIIIVGCSVEPELKALNATALTLTLVGGIILFFGLAGGWWISSRAIQPIENISKTAVKISAGDLSQRINMAETESELGRLAALLNSTFERLDAAFAQQKQFASDAAHELRTPVSVILTQTQTVLARERDAKDYKQTVEACQRAAQRMRGLIATLLELARLDAGQEQMKRLRFDLSMTIGDSVELVRPLADGRGVKVIVEGVPLEITGDSEKLAQVITNLLTNAIQYNHDGGEVKITSKAESGMAVLAVSDTGQGIAAADLPHIFERFYRADKSRSSGNAGLGLAISRAIIAAHGGTIEVSSREKVGTTFTVCLPL